MAQFLLLPAGPARGGRRRAGRRRAWLAAALAVGGCGPSEVEIGQVMLLSCVPVLGLTIMLEWAYVAIKYRRREARPDRVGWRSAAGLIAGTATLVAIGVGARGWHVSLDWLVGIVAFFVVGYCGYLAIALLIAHRAPGRRRSLAAVLAPYTVVVLSGLIVSLAGSADPDRYTRVSILVTPLAYSGVYFIGVGLLAVAFVWAWIRPFPPPPPVPLAQARPRRR